MNEPTSVRKLRCSTLTMDGATVQFRMESPQTRNALTSDLREDLQDMLDAVQGTASVRALIVCGSDGAFCAGGDLKALVPDRTPDGYPLRNVEAIRARMSEHHRWFERLYNLEVPVIAAVDGPAFGAGFSLALASDYILASPRASFCMAFNRIGALPDLAALYMLPRMIGQRRAKDLMMSARRVDADEALALGIVHSLHPQDRLLDEARAMAADFSNGSKEALALTKTLSNQSLGSDYATMARLEGLGQSVCLTSDYFYDAVARFIDHKPGRFTWNR